jgi:hypothetical protein
MFISLNEFYSSRTELVYLISGRMCISSYKQLYLSKLMCVLHKPMSCTSWQMLKFYRSLIILLNFSDQRVVLTRVTMCTYERVCNLISRWIYFLRQLLSINEVYISTKYLKKCCKKTHSWERCALVLVSICAPLYMCTSIFFVKTWEQYLMKKMGRNSQDYIFNFYGQHRSEISHVLKK